MCSYPPEGVVGVLELAVLVELLLPAAVDLLFVELLLGRLVGLDDQVQVDRPKQTHDPTGPQDQPVEADNLGAEGGGLEGEGTALDGVGLEKVAVVLEGGVAAWAEGYLVMRRMAEAMLPIVMNRNTMRVMSSP